MIIPARQRYERNHEIRSFSSDFFLREPGILVLRWYDKKADALARFKVYEHVAFKLRIEPRSLPLNIFTFESNSIFIGEASWTILRHRCS
jgi:hypothetical protein